MKFRTGRNSREEINWAKAEKLFPCLWWSSYARGAVEKVTMQTVFAFLIKRCSISLFLKGSALYKLNPLEINSVECKIAYPGKMRHSITNIVILINCLLSSYYVLEWTRRCVGLTQMYSWQSVLHQYAWLQGCPQKQPLKFAKIDYTKHLLTIAHQEPHAPRISWQ